MTVKILYLIALLDALNMALVLPLINPHVRTLGGSLSLVGVLTSLSSGAQLFSSPVVGSWSDTRGRKLLLLSTLSVVLISNIMSGVSSLTVFFLARILYGFAHQTDPLIRALISDSVPQDQLSDKFNKLMAVLGLAFILAPVLGGMLYEVFQSFGYISIILSALDIAAISVVFFFVEDKEKRKSTDDKQKEQTQKTTFLKSVYADLGKVFSNLKNVNWSRYGDLLAIKFFAEAAFSMVFTNMGVILMEKFSFTRTQMGIAIAYISILMIASTFLASFIIKTFYKTDKTGFQRITHAFIALLMSFSVLPFANTSALYLFLFAPLFIAKTLLDSTWMEVLTKKTTESDKGVMMGAATSMVSLSGLVCPLISGFTGDFIGIAALTVLPLFPSVMGTILVNKVKHRTVDVDKTD